MSTTKPSIPLPSTSVLERFFRLFGSYAVLVYEFLKNSGAIHNTAGSVGTMITAASVEKLRQSNRLLWIGLVKDCIASGQMRSDVNPDMVVRAMWDGVMGTPRWFPPQGRRRPEAVADQIVALFLDGLLVK